MTAAQDLGRETQRRIGEVLERQVRIAQHVLEPADLIIMIMGVAVSTCLTAAATCAATIDDGAGVEEFFDFTLASIERLARGDRERSLAEIRKKRASREQAA